MFTAIKDGKSRITIITFRVSQFTENNIVNEEQRRLHIDSFYSRSPRKATNHCLCFFRKLFIYVNQGLSSLARGEGKRRGPGNEVG